MEKNSILSKDRMYRYALWRIWDSSKPYAMFICLNPSTANETEDDQTVRRCIGFAKKWGYGGVYMTNLFAFRTTNPKHMKLANDPIGPENDYWLNKISKKAGVNIGAWGNNGSFKKRSLEIKKILHKLKYLELNKSGEPKHPLYIKADCKPKLMQ